MVKSPCSQSFSYALFHPPRNAPRLSVPRSRAAVAVAAAAGVAGKDLPQVGLKQLENIYYNYYYVLFIMYYYVLFIIIIIIIYNYYYYVLFIIVVAVAVV